mmetsp:Transcript_42520/g.97433  ORF Transcript_42520/g.97433 Transcript_42520/m.97433 type:complete len:501 (+) Transcript_42520:43-1545(+)
MWRLWFAGTLAVVAPAAQGGHSIAAGGYHSVFVQDTGGVAVAGWNSRGQLCLSGSIGEDSESVSLLTDSITQPVKSVVAGLSFSILIMSDNTVKVCGSNDHGQLGTGGGMQAAYPTAALLNLPGAKAEHSPVRSVAAGANHTLFLTLDGLVWSVGQNDAGQLCNDDYEDAHIPMADAFVGAKAVAAGRSHSLILAEKDNKVFACGSNSNWQLGTASNATVATPVGVLTGVQAIAAGDAHSLFLLLNGTVLGVGDNSNGQLGIPGESEVHRPTIIPGLEGKKIVGIAAAGNHSLFLGSLAAPENGHVWATGQNDYGQLGDDTQTTQRSLVEVSSLEGPVVDMSTGPFHSIFLSKDGRAYATGLNNHGQLGLDSSDNEDRPQLVLLNAAVAIQIEHPWRVHTEQSGPATTTITTTTEDTSWPGMPWWQWMLLCTCLCIPCFMVCSVFLCEPTRKRQGPVVGNRQDRVEANRDWSRTLDEMDLTAEESRPLVTPNVAQAIADE